MSLDATTRAVRRLGTVFSAMTRVALTLEERLRRHDKRCRMSRYATETPRRGLRAGADHVALCNEDSHRCPRHVARRDGNGSRSPRPFHRDDDSSEVRTESGGSELDARAPRRGSPPSETGACRWSPPISDDPNGVPTVPPSPRVSQRRRTESDRHHSHFATRHLEAAWHRSHLIFRRLSEAGTDRSGSRPGGVGE